MQPKNRDLLAGLTVVVVACGYTSAVAVGLISHHQAKYVSDFGTSAVALLAGLVAAIAARSYPQGRVRRGWTLLGAATISWGLGNSVWTYYEFFAHREVPFPSFADVGYLGFVPLAAGAVLCFSNVPKGSSSSIRTLLDAGLIGSSIFFVSWTLVLHQLYQGASGPLLGKVIGLAYPVSDVAIVSLVVFVVARTKSERRVPLLMIGTALGGLAFADSGFAYLTLIGKYSSGNPIDTGWVGGFALIGVAAAVGRPRDRSFEESRRSLSVHLPYVVAGTALLVGVVTAVAERHVSQGVLWGIVGLLAIVLVRQFLVVVEHQKLTIEHLHSVDEMKTGILHAVSHELRTPLTYMKGAAAMLDDATVELHPQNRRRLTSRLVANCDRLEQLLSGLLDLGRLTRGVLEPARKPTDIGGLMLEVARTVGTHDHTIEIDPCGVMANVDPAQVERIIENLFVNAVRHTPAGTMVFATAQTTSDGVHIVVEDTGPGIPEEVRKQIFDPFVQTAASADSGRGTGIGLALVAKFAELHGGRAWVDRGNAGGARFHVLLLDDAVAV